MPQKRSWAKGLMWTGEYRLFPEIFTKAFDAFESGPIERYRRVQPATIATAHLARAIIYEAIGDERVGERALRFGEGLF